MTDKHKDHTDGGLTGEPLLSGEEYFRIISELTSDFAYVDRVEPDGSIVPVWVSDAVARVTGYATEEIISRGLKAIVHPDDWPVVREHIKQVLSGRTDVVESRVITRGGEVLWLRDYARPVWDETQGRVVRIYGASQDITGQRRAEEERSRVERDYLDFVENAAVGLHWVGADGIILWANQAELDLLGYSREEYVGRAIADFHTDPGVIADILRRLSAGETLHSYEARLRHKDGSVRHVLISSNVRWDGERFLHTRCFTRDVTELKRAEEARALLASIVESSDDAIISKDLEGTVLSWNKGAERLYGYSTGEMIGRSISLLMPADQADDFPKIMTALRRGDRVDHYETKRQRKDGEILQISLTVSPLKDASGEVIGASAIARDITGQKRLEREREDLLERELAARREAEYAHQLSAELLRREQAAREEADAANRMKDEFLAVVSHELRSPLNAILGWAGILNGDQADPRTAAQAVETIQRNAKAQAQLIDDLLDISRVVTGKMRLDVQPVEMPLVLQAAVDAVRPAAEGKGIRLQMVIDPGAGPVSGDPGRLQQIFWNLLSNAVKFTPKNGTVRVQLERANSYVEVTVSDSGRGISADFLPYVFDRFRQADSSFTRAHGGLGLGLAIVRQLVELHGGTVAARSEGEGRGATFTVSLPIAIRNDVARYITGALAAKEPAGAADKVDCSLRLDGLTVVIVDDERDARELLLTILKDCGAEVRAAVSAAEGFEAVGEWRPDLLISDIEMPHEDGLSLIRRIRALPSDGGGQVPAIALTAHVRSEDRLRALAAGFDAQVGKPMEPVELVTVVASLMRRTGKGGR